MGIYTRTGDDGTTGLRGGVRVSKSDPMIECLGALDELNAAVGLAAAAAAEPLVSQLRAVQRDIFAAGACMSAMRDGGARGGASFAHAATARLEKDIDAAEKALPPLRNFILPGGCEAAARLHVARTVCRRAERRMVRLAEAENLDRALLAWMNRLGDWLFAVARLANHAAGVADITWP